MGVGGTYIAGDAPDLPRVTWYKHKGLIKLYLVCPYHDHAVLIKLAPRHCPLFFGHYRLRWLYGMFVFKFLANL
jgi:hypothetical protein